MPIPPGIDQAFVWCLLWFGFEVALVGLITPLMNAAHLDERVSSRTYRRLGRLNSYLDSQVDVAWLQSEEIIPDLPALIRLEVEVQRAGAVRNLSIRRIKALEAARLLGALEAGIAVLFAGVAAFTGLRAELNGIGSVAFAVGTSIAVLLMIQGAYIATKIDDGDDYL